MMAAKHIVAVVCATAAISCVRAQAVVPLSVNFSQTVRTDFLGIGGVRHGFDYMAEETYRGLNDTYRAQSLARICDSRLRIARTWYGSDWAMPLWGAPLNFSSPRFTQFAQWVADMHACNVTVAFAAGWWFTQNTCDPAPPSTCTPTDADVAVYTQWVSASIQELVVRRGLTNFNILVFFTEPLSYNSGNVPAGYTQETFYAHVLTALHAQLVADGVRSLVRIMAPNDGGLQSPSIVQALNFTIQNLNSIVDIYSSHDYNVKDYPSYLAMYASATSLTSPTGKPFLVDEGGDGDESYRNSSAYGTYIAMMHAAAINAGASGFTQWLWQDQYYVWPLQNASNGDSFYNGLHRWGVAPWLPYDTNVRPAYYVLSALAAHMGPRALGLGAVAASVATSGYVGGVAVAALAGVGDDGGFRSIMLVNNVDSPVNVSITLNDYVCNCLGSQTLQRYLYDPAAPPTNNLPLQPSGTYDGSGAPIQDTLPGYGVLFWSG